MCPPQKFKYKRSIQNSQGKVLSIFTNEDEFNLKFHYEFFREFCSPPHPNMEGSDVQYCFTDYLHPFVDMIEDIKED